MTTAEAEVAPVEEPASDERLAYRGPIQRLLTRPEIGALVGAAVIWVYFWAVSEVFGTAAGAAVNPSFFYLTGIREPAGACCTSWPSV